MFKTFLTLLRGLAGQRSEAFTDKHSIPLLDQQIKDAAQDIGAMRKAVALATAQQQQEHRHQTKLVDQIADLETRIIDALGKGEELLAQEGANSLALLIDERVRSEQILERFKTDLIQFRTDLRKAEQQLRQLRQGQRVAQVRDRSQKLGHAVPNATETNLQDAMATLDRLTEQQQHRDDAQKALKTLSIEGSSDAVKEKLAAAGCGAPLQTSAAEILESLRHQAQNPKALTQR